MLRRDGCRDGSRRGDPAASPGLLRIQGAGGPALRFMAARLPIIPWLGDHGRLGGQHGNLKIVGIFVGKERHRIGKGGIERRALGSLIVRIAKRQRSDQCALLVAGRAGKGLRLAQRCESRCIGLGCHRHIDVGAQHQCFAEIAHGATRIELLSLAERPLGLRMVKVDIELQALVEIVLGLGAAGGDRVGEGAEIAPERRRCLQIGLRSLVLLVLSGDIHRHAMRLDAVGEGWACSEQQASEARSQRQKLRMKSHRGLRRMARDG